MQLAPQYSRTNTKSTCLSGLTMLLVDLLSQTGCKHLQAAKAVLMLSPADALVQDKTSHSRRSESVSRPKQSCFPQVTGSSAQARPQLCCCVGSPQLCCCVEMPLSLAPVLSGDKRNSVHCCLHLLLMRCHCCVRTHCNNLLDEQGDPHIASKGHLVSDLSGQWSPQDGTLSSSAL